MKGTPVINIIINILDGFGQLDGLVELDLGQNALSNLPNSVSSLTSLKKLSLDQNAITNLPQDFV
jgi:Leucine-rich repeat (LRR) protein